LRLQQCELASLREHGRVVSKVRFGRNSLEYALEVNDAALEIAARYDSDAIVVVVPTTIASRWYAPGETSIIASQPLPDGTSLAIRIEKDFACLDVRDGEDDGDAFPRPDEPR
jgi:hypothetical protein